MLKNNLKIIRDKIIHSAIVSNRDFKNIKLIAVSKTHPISSIMECIASDVTDFGENKAIEFRDKSELIKEKVNWHFIGHLQTNKVKYVIKNAYCIHSVESTKLADEINKRAKQFDKIQNVLIEMNTSFEESKFGLNSYDELCELLNKINDLENVNPIGLMTMASFTDDEQTVRKSFIMLREMRDKINNKYKSIRELSMGMTNDYTLAIEEGATMLRVGTAIFNSRDVSLKWSDK